MCFLPSVIEKREAGCAAGDATSGQALLTRVESTAQAHRAYPLLFDICALLGDRGRLHAHMTTDAFRGPAAPGWTQSFAAYCFDRRDCPQPRPNPSLSCDVGVSVP